MKEQVPFFSRSIQVQFSHDVTKENVLAAIERVLNVSGCSTCGIRGIDLRLIGSDPIFQEVGRLPGVASIVSQAAAE
jgi:hypothetical protein